MLLFFGQKFAPKLIMFTCLTAALRIDPLGDGARMNFAMFRSFITISACVIYYVLGLAYTKLAHPSFLRQLFGRRHPLHTLYLYALRGLVIYAYVSISPTLTLSLTLTLTLTLIQALTLTLGGTTSRPTVRLCRPVPSHQQL